MSLTCSPLSYLGGAGGKKKNTFHVPNIVERGQFGGGSVMVWGGISCSGAAKPLTVNGSLTAIGYHDNIHKPVTLPYLRQGNADVLQHDKPGLTELG